VTKTVAVFTGNRAEYGLQFPILRAIRTHPDLDYKLLVSGAHLDPDFGQTMDEIRADGFEIHSEIKIEMKTDSVSSTAQAIGSGVLSISNALAVLNPDIFVVYADRFEGFAAVIAGTQMNIPTAHIEGGDITEGGALDDSVRHAMTKLAHFHFTTNAQASNRVLGMGEESWRVCTAGFPVIDLIKSGDYASPAELQQWFGIDPDRPLVVFTQHSVTTEFDQAENQIRPSLEAMRRAAGDGTQVLMTYPNNDAGGRVIIAALENFAAEKIDGISLHQSMGRSGYHGALALAMDPNRRIACIGNSSSGVKETPAFGCPTINIGSRQDGRLRGNNVLDAGYEADAIYAAIQKCLNDEDWRSICAATDNPYGQGNAGEVIADYLAALTLDPTKILRKKMTLGGEARDGWFR